MRNIWKYVCLVWILYFDIKDMSRLLKSFNTSPLLYNYIISNLMFHIESIFNDKLMHHFHSKRVHGFVLDVNYLSISMMSYDAPFCYSCDMYVGKFHGYISCIKLNRENHRYSGQLVIRSQTKFNKNLCLKVLKLSLYVV